MQYGNAFARFPGERQELRNGEASMMIRTVYALDVFPGGRWVVAGDSGGFVWVWDPLGGDVRSRDRVLDGPVFALKVLPSGREILVAGSGGRLVLWRWETHRALWEQRFPRHLFSLSLLDGLKVAVGDEAGVIHVVNWKTGAILWQMQGHLDGVNTLACCGGGHVLASGGWDGKVLVWDWRRGEVIRRVEVGSGVHGVRFVGKMLWIGEDGGRVWVWDWWGKRPPWKLTAHRSGCLSLEADALEQHVVMGFRDGEVEVWAGSEGRKLARWKVHAGPVFRVAFLDGTRVVVGGEREGVSLWDWRVGRRYRRLQGKTPPFPYRWSAFRPLRLRESTALPAGEMRWEGAHPRDA